MKQTLIFSISSVIAAVVAIASLIGLTVQQTLSHEATEDNDNNLAQSDEVNAACTISEQHAASIIKDQMDSESEEFFIGCGTIL